MELHTLETGLPRTFNRIIELLAILQPRADWNICRSFVMIATSNPPLAPHNYNLLALAETIANFHDIQIGCDCKFGTPNNLTTISPNNFVH
jgi:hypothetical protein